MISNTLDRGVLLKVCYLRPLYRLINTSQTHPCVRGLFLGSYLNRRKFAWRQESFLDIGDNSLCFLDIACVRCILQVSHVLIGDGVLIPLWKIR